jgi:type III secretory pathway component EscR
LYSLDTKDVVESGIADEILKLADKGRDQYRTFLSRMRDGDNPGFYEPLIKNPHGVFVSSREHSHIFL